MATNYPASLDSYAAKVDSVDDVMASHVNNLQDAVVAIETELGTQPRNSTTTAPGVGDDTGDNYSVGTIWTDTTNDRIYVAIDVSAGAAIWHQIAPLVGPKTAAPTANDDSGDGYIDGSVWIDTTNDRAYILADNTATSAVWLEVEHDYTEPMTAMDFYIVSGTPAQGSLDDGTYGMATWRMDDSSTEVVGAAFEYKGGRGGSTVYIDLWWAMETATSGSVRWSPRINALADGEDATSSPSADAQSIAVPGTAKYIKQTTFTISETYAVGDLINVVISRAGAHAGDTSTGDAHVIAATVRFG